MNDWNRWHDLAQRWPSHVAYCARMAAIAAGVDLGFIDPTTEYVLAIAYEQYRRAIA
ncbi:MAG TPA: hypothetical protein VI172_03975 [Candidatus Dormibacteraeota bacterium]